MTESTVEPSLATREEPVPAPAPDEERHRPLIREINRSLSASYGYGGGAVLLVTALVVAIGAALGGLLSLSTWFFAITIALLSLFVLSAVLRRRRAAMRGRFEDYCRLNGLSDEALREYFVGDGTYPYFDALFEAAGSGRSASLDGPERGSRAITSEDDQG